MLLGYVRVSTDDQETHLQIDALKAAGCERIFQEKMSGVRSDRPEFNRLLDQARKGDVVMVWKLDRLGRSVKQLIETVERLDKVGVQLKSLIDTTSPSGKLIFGVFAVIAEFERDMLRQRTMAGLAAAKKHALRPESPQEQHQFSSRNRDAERFRISSQAEFGNKKVQAGRNVGCQ